MKRPNILIFMTDHQRADTSYPEHGAITPNLDNFAKEGLLFRNTFCPSPHCCPARATFFSGLYPSRHGVWNNVCNRQAHHRGLKEGVRLWSEDLADAGYRMQYFGKWHVSSLEGPADRGWQTGFASGTNPFEHDVRWETYREIAKKPPPQERQPGQILRPGYGPYSLYGVEEPTEADHDEKAVRGGVSFLETLEDSDEPWALYVGVNGPHDPYNIPQEFLDLYDPRDIPLPASFEDDLADKPVIARRMREQVFGQLTPDEVREGIRHFWAYCSYLDHLFGQLLAALDETGMKEDTLVIYLSDHGDYCGEHGLFAKGIPCYQGAYRVPLVVRYPRGIRNPGREEIAFISLADFAPTILEIAGIETDRSFTGKSFMPFLEGNIPEDWREAIHTQCDGVELYYTQRSVMTRNHKYVFNGFDRDELYDLRHDPDEMNNLIDDPAYQPIIKALCREMWAFAYQEEDSIINRYITVALAPFGPAILFEQEG
jgi:arylsulfatase A-like enzyme